MLSPAQVIERLETIEQDLANRQNEWEEAAEDLARVTREWTLALAMVMLTVEGASKEKREATALTTLAAQQPDLYERLTESEAKVNANQKAFNVLDRRSSIGQSILRAHTREQFDAPQPQWSRAA
jgi:hypothetical protein